jgi:thioesterase domain-containing protein
MGWSDWAAGGVELHIVPGNHANMMYQPHVRALALTLTACLKQAQSATDKQEARKSDQ